MSWSPQGDGALLFKGIAELFIKRNGDKGDDKVLDDDRRTFLGDDMSVVSIATSRRSLPAESLERAIATLRSGRYPIVNEMETGLNRSLVGTVIELFASPVTNPKGATLLPKYPDVQAMRDYVCRRVNE